MPARAAASVKARSLPRCRWRASRSKQSPAPTVSTGLTRGAGMVRISLAALGDQRAFCAERDDRRAAAGGEQFLRRAARIALAGEVGRLMLVGHKHGDLAQERRGEACAPARG